MRPEGVSFDNPNPRSSTINIAPHYWPPPDRHGRWQRMTKAAPFRGMSCPSPSPFGVLRQQTVGQGHLGDERKAREGKGGKGAYRTYICSHFFSTRKKHVLAYLEGSKKCTHTFYINYFRILSMQRVHLMMRCRRSGRVGGTTHDAEFLP